MKLLVLERLPLLPNSSIIGKSFECTFMLAPFAAKLNFFIYSLLVKSFWFLLCKECLWVKERARCKFLFPELSRHQQNGTTKNVLNFLSACCTWLHFQKSWISFCFSSFCRHFYSRAHFACFSKKCSAREFHLARGGASEKCLISSIRLKCNAKKRRRVENCLKKLYSCKESMSNYMRCMFREDFQAEELEMEVENPRQDNSLMGDDWNITFVKIVDKAFTAVSGN